jgi:hypothetical protein
VKVKAEADRVLEDANSKAVCMHKRAQAAVALAENIDEGRRLVDVLTRGCADEPHPQRAFLLTALTASVTAAKDTNAPFKSD